MAATKPESCSVCHKDQGNVHQAIYDTYTDASQLKLTVTGLTSTPTAPTWTVSMAFSITYNGVPYDDAGLVNLDQKRFIVQGYDSSPTAAYPYPAAWNKGLTTITSLGAGNYTASATGVLFDPLALTGAIAYGYVADNRFQTEEYELYADASNAGLELGDAGTYVSTANVVACESCHGSPYQKHGYRAAEADGLQDFAACKSCHMDDRAGGHRDWQYMADRPFDFFSGVPLPALPAYEYQASVMQDTHQTHAMEFAYPQGMSNCNTCHQGNLARILDDKFFKKETCKSCHAVDGVDTWAGQKYEEANRPPSLKELWNEADADGAVAWHDPTDDCSLCHNASGPGSQFTAYHNGYNKEIYDASGQKYAALNTVTIDSATRTGDVLNVKFTSSNPAVVPTLTVSMYGYDTKDFLISCHTRDANSVRMEYTAGTANPLFTDVPTGVPGKWDVNLNLAAYVPVTTTGLPSIPTLITEGKVKRAEIAVLPNLVVDGETVAMNAPSATFDLAGNALVAAAAPVVEVAKCNACHDQLATTFHNGSYGGNVVVCRTCHAVTSPSGHLEMQSRSIDAYAHAIHSFQAFDMEAVDFTDPVEAGRYEHHTQVSAYPNFTITNCESCHAANMFNVPDQAKSMPSQQSASTPNPTLERAIGDVPEYVTGAASRACGSCHRARMINADEAGELASFNSHVGQNGILIDDTDGDYLYGVIDKIMSYFD